MGRMDIPTATSCWSRGCGVLAKVFPRDDTPSGQIDILRAFGANPSPPGVPQVHASNPTGGVAAAAAALDLSPVARLFADPWVTLLAWVHLLALDVLMARFGGGGGGVLCGRPVAAVRECRWASGRIAERSTLCPAASVRTLAHRVPNVGVYGVAVLPVPSRLALPNLANPLPGNWLVPAPLLQGDRPGRPARGRGHGPQRAAVLLLRTHGSAEPRHHAPGHGPRPRLGLAAGGLQCRERS